MQQLLFEPGETIFAQGEPSDLAYLILAGSVDIVVVDAAGAERRIASLGPEEVFGEMGVIDPGPRSATALAREPTACEAYSADEVIELMSSDPAKAMEIVRSLIVRLRGANRKLSAKSPLATPKPPN